jgi:hypothetical protein
VATTASGRAYIAGGMTLLEALSVYFEHTGKICPRGIFLYL